MKKIYLFCAAGMSTSMLAKNMQESADKHGLPVKVQAHSHNDLETIINEDRPDCILLGPQVKFRYQETVDNFGHHNIPIDVIDATDYGLMNGENVLKSAVKLIKANK